MVSWLIKQQHVRFFQQQPAQSYTTALTFFLWTILLLGGASTIFGPSLGAVLFWMVMALLGNLLPEMAKAGCSIADIAAGMYAYTNILSALLLRGRTGEGSHIDVSMLEALGEWMGYPMYYAFDGAPPPPRTGATRCVRTCWSTGCGSCASASC